MFLKKCHHEYKTVGVFYKEIPTEYKNCFDEINVYRKDYCQKCGRIDDILLSSEKFQPEMYDYCSRREKDVYIMYLRKKGIGLEIDLYGEIYGMTKLSSSTSSTSNSLAAIPSAIKEMKL